jgi:hypothetical protein
MHFRSFGILETDQETRGIRNVFPAQVDVSVDEEAGRVLLAPVESGLGISLREEVDRPDLPLRQGGFDVGGQRVEVVYLGENIGDVSAGEGMNQVYAIRDRASLDRLKSVMRHKSGA